HDRTDDEDADDCSLPEVGYPEDRQCSIDGLQKDGSDRGAEDGPRTTEDRDPTDDDGADGLQFPAGAGLGGHGAVAGGVQHPGEASERAGDGHRRQEPAGDLQPVQVGGIGIGADGVILAPAASVVHVPGSDDEDEYRDDRQERYAEEFAGAQVQERAGHVGGVDPAGTGPHHRHAAVDVHRAQGEHEGGYLRVGDEHPIEEPEHGPERGDDEKYRDDRDPGVVDE